MPELPASNRPQRLDDQEQRLVMHGKLRDHYIHDTELTESLEGEPEAFDLESLTKPTLKPS